MIQRIYYEQCCSAAFQLSKSHFESSCPHNCHYDDLTIRCGTDKQAHENVLRQINQKEFPDFIDSNVNYKRAFSKMENDSTVPIHTLF